jgi:uncharacterized membrane protein HdeD (DUF308 family)
MQIQDSQERLGRKWPWILLLGIVLVVCGVVAVILPALSTIAVSTVLGIVLVIAGVVKIIEALQVKEWAGSTWHLLIGAVEAVGGILIYLNPVKGALAVTLLIAIVFLIQGIMQIALAFRVRPQTGWGWLLVAGLIALSVCAAMVLKLRYTSFYTPGTIAGVALLVAGCAYVAMALANRRAWRAPHLA